MKTTLELPDRLMREVKIRAAQTDRKRKDVIADLNRAQADPRAAEGTPGAFRI
ncbi:MAG: hypothetical protein ACR2HE_09835 [Casimicrobiaceae bacterium]